MERRGFIGSLLAPLAAVIPLSLSEEELRAYSPEPTKKYILLYDRDRISHAAVQDLLQRFPPGCAALAVYDLEGSPLHLYKLD